MKRLIFRAHYHLFYFFGVFLLVMIPAWLCGKFFCGMPNSFLWMRLVYLGIQILTLFVILRYSKGTGIKILSVLLFNVIFLLQILEFSSFYLLQTTFNDAFFLTMTDFGTLWYDGKYFWREIAGAAIGIVIFNVLLACRKRTGPEKTNRVFSAIGFLLFLLFLCVGFFFDTALCNFSKMLRNNLGSDHFSNVPVDLSLNADYGIKCSNITPETLATGKCRKNLVFIILESCEKNYLDEELFPGLTPNLNAFYHHPDTLAFANMQSTASNTTCSMFETFYGMPMISIMNGTNQDFRRLGSATNSCNGEAMKTLCSLPEIYQCGAGRWLHLQTNGMWQAMRSVADCSKLDRSGWKEIVAQKGENDHVVFDAAWQLFQKRAQDGKPFAISVSTIDGHAPNGRVDSFTIKYSDAPPEFPEKYQQMLNSVHTTDYYLGQLIRNIQHHPTGKDTVIVVMSDHLCFSSLDGYLNKKERNLLFFIMNGRYHGEMMNKCYTFDIAPTVLDSIGLKSNYTFPVGESVIPGRKNDPKRETSLTDAGRNQLTRNIIRKITDSATAKRLIEGQLVTGGHIGLNVFGMPIPVVCYAYTIPQKDNMMIVSLDKNNIIVKNQYCNTDDLDEAGVGKWYKECTSQEYNQVLFCSTENKIFRKLYPGFDATNPNLRYAIGYKGVDGIFKWNCAVAPTLLRLDIDGEAKQMPNYQIHQIGDVWKIDLPDYFWPAVAKRHENKIVFPDVKQLSLTLPIRVDIENGKKLVCSGKISCCDPNSAGANCYVFFNAMDEKGRPMGNTDYYEEETDFIIADDCPAETTTLAIKPLGKQWENENSVHTFRLMALDAKHDLSDLPNKNILRIKSIEKENGNIVIVLQEPLKQEIKKGTYCRIHRDELLKVNRHHGAWFNSPWNFEFAYDLETIRRIPNVKCLYVTLYIHPYQNGEGRFAVENFEIRRE